MRLRKMSLIIYLEKRFAEEQNISVYERSKLLIKRITLLRPSISSLCVRLIPLHVQVCYQCFLCTDMLHVIVLIPCST